MELIEPRAAMLSNFEVYAIVNAQEELRKAKSAPASGKEDLTTVESELLEYLKETSPCVHRTPEQINVLLTALKDFELTKAEKLQLINLRPVQPVEIVAIVEEWEERFPDDQSMSDLIDIISSTLIIPENNVN